MEITKTITTTTSDTVSVADLFARYEKLHRVADQEIIASLIKSFRWELNVEVPYKIILRVSTGHLSVRDKNGVIGWDELKRQLTALVPENFKVTL